MSNLLTLDKLTIDNKYKDDLLVESNNIIFVAEGETNSVRLQDDFLSQSGMYELSTVAKQQLCSTVGIPLQYFDKCPDWLRKQNMDYHLSRMSKNFFARTYKGHPERENQVRGFLSEKYGVIDYAPTVAAINNVIGTDIMKQPVIMKDYYADDILRIHVVDKAAEVMEGSFSGIMVTNSELGLHKLDASFAVYTLVCTNGLVLPRMVSGFSRRHIGSYETLNQDLYGAIKNFDDVRNKVSQMLKDSSLTYSHD